MTNYHIKNQYMEFTPTEPERVHCGQCGPGYFLGDDGCRHTGKDDVHYDPDDHEYYPGPEYNVTMVEDELHVMARDLFNKARWESLKGTDFVFEPLDIYGPMTEEVEWVDTGNLLDRLPEDQEFPTCSALCDAMALVEVGWTLNHHSGDYSRREVACLFHSVLMSSTRKYNGTATTIRSLSTGRML